MYVKLNNGLFPFKLELLLAILSHSGIKFDILFNFTQRMLERNWSFEKFWLIVLIIARREIQIVDELSTASSAKTKNMGQISKLEWLHIKPYQFFLKSGLKKNVLNIINFIILKEHTRAF